MTDIKFKSKIGDKEVALKIIPENLLIQKRCDEEYHLAYLSLLKKGILPRVTLERLMAQNEIWTPEHEDMVRNLQLKVVALELKLSASNTKDEGVVVAGELAEARRALYKLIEGKTSVLEHCCESIADIVRQEAYIAYATVYEDTNKQVFKDYADFLAKKDEQVVLDAMNALTENLKNAFIRTVDSLPESKFIAEQKVAETA